MDAWLINSNDFTAESFTRSFTFDSSGKKCPATTQAGNSYSLYFGGNDTIFTQLSYPFHFGYAWHYWSWYYYDYSWYYNYWNLWQSYTLSFWVKSDAPSPLNQTLFFGSSNNGADVLQISLTGSTTNNLRVATTNTSLRSNTAFDITKWHHVVVQFQENEPVALYVDDVDVTVAGGSVLTGSNFTQPWTLMIGSQGSGSTVNGYSVTNGFAGYLDEIKIFPGTTTIADGTVNTYCEDSPTLNTITVLPSENPSYSTVDFDDYVNLHTIGKWPGKYNVLLQKNGVSIVKALTDLMQNRTWQGVIADADSVNSKAVVHFDSQDIAGHGHDPAQDPHTLFVKKNLTSTFLVCPDATVLADVHSGCTNGVLFEGPFPQTQKVSGLNVEVGLTSFEDGSYWYASGLTGSGGEGEGGLIEVPLFSYKA